jgi:hypothetical protein
MTSKKLSCRDVLKLSGLSLAGTVLYLLWTGLCRHPRARNPHTRTLTYKGSCHESKNSYHLCHPRRFDR